MNQPDIPAWFTSRGAQCTQPPGVREALTFEPQIRIFGGAQIGAATIGAYSYLAPGTVLNRVEIGRYCSIGDRCTFGPTQHPNNWLTTSPIPYKTVFDGTALPPGAPTHDELAEVRVGNDVWIGANSAVMGGVTIGDGAIVGYGSVVTRDVPPYAIVGGTPARLIRMRFEPEIVARLIEARWWQYDLVRTRGDALPWSDPLAALHEIERRARNGEVDLVGPTLHRITRQGANGFAFAKLA